MSNWCNPTSIGHLSRVNGNRTALGEVGGVSGDGDGLLRQPPILTVFTLTFVLCCVIGSIAK
jgi:hypothetical protein